MRSLESWLEERHKCKREDIDYVTSLACDWLEEEGDPRAEALRWLHDNKLCPNLSGNKQGTGNSWDWWEIREGLSQVSCLINEWLLDSLEGYSDRGGRRKFREYLTRLAAEVALLNVYVVAKKKGWKPSC